MNVIHAHRYMCAQAHMPVHIYEYMYMCGMYVDVYAHGIHLPDTCACVCAHVAIYMCTYIHISINVYINRGNRVTVRVNVKTNYYSYDATVDSVVRVCIYLHY